MWEKPAAMVRRIEWNERNMILKVWFSLLLVWLAAFCSTVSVAVSAAACGLLLVYCRCCSYCVSCAAFFPFNFTLSFTAIVRVTTFFWFAAAWAMSLLCCFRYMAVQISLDGFNLLGKYLLGRQQKLSLQQLLDLLQNWTLVDWAKEECILQAKLSPLIHFLYKVSPKELLPGSSHSNEPDWRREKSTGTVREWDPTTPNAFSLISIRSNNCLKECFFFMHRRRALAQLFKALGNTSPCPLCKFVSLEKSHDL